VPTGCRWLDLGCGHQMFAEWMTREEDELAARASIIVGADLDFEGLKKNRFANLRIMANLESLPSGPPASTSSQPTWSWSIRNTQGSCCVRFIGRSRPAGCFVHTPNRFNPLTRIAARTPHGLKIRMVSFLEGRAEEDIFPAFFVQIQLRKFAPPPRPPDWTFERAPRFGVRRPPVR
jgi:hypothetical protein